MMQRRFAAFDIDGTIFRWQLYHELFDALIGEGIVSSEDAVQVLQAREGWQARQSSYHDYEMSLVKLMNRKIIGLDASRFDSIADDILKRKGHRTHQYTLQLLLNLKAEGYFIIAISGSHQQLVDKFAKLYGIDVAIGRKYEIRSGKLTAEVKDIFGHKHEILAGIVETHNLTFDGSYAIGDSGGDIEMLRIVEHPIAFNPDETLRGVAMEEGWDIVLERKNLAYVLKKGADGSYLLAETDSR